MGDIAGDLRLGIGIFKTHASPGGSLTFGGIAIAAAWLEWQRLKIPGLLDK